MATILFTTIPDLHFSFGMPPSSLSDLTRVRADERLWKAHKRHIASFGRSWIKSAGCAKTARLEEEQTAHREVEHDALAGLMDNFRIPEQPDNALMMELDLDHDIPGSDFEALYLKQERRGEDHWDDGLGFGGEPFSADVSDFGSVPWYSPVHLSHVVGDGLEEAMGYQRAHRRQDNASGETEDYMWVDRPRFPDILLTSTPLIPAMTGGRGIVSEMQRSFVQRLRSQDNGLDDGTPALGGDFDGMGQSVQHRRADRMTMPR
ncbi:uncharacterized protein N7473_011140 [Penicillium subrubescens]|uniref:Uncharacterized protein n=1 Tax=Penicillium subrubescens TaxID=1316194 RepID=A0A1Q5UA36_9EURO|nr:uncharacterized protein N7473_011140 [Penicillium subrubescens]KAJ5882706.1 hypothetical protein N7473_011140 [Penicillium subrubescens]OKP09331.1 hypothetical protein PENSUB_5325 [Penicillium subrubescens]